MRVSDVADILRLNQQTVRNWIDDGRLPALRIGRRVDVLRSDLQRLIDESEYRPRAQQHQPDATYTARAFWDGSPDFLPVQLP